VAEDFNSFGRSMVQKLIAEIAAIPAPRRWASARPVSAKLHEDGVDPTQ
jgi:hypothetical protein